jgi:hypothetical protein
MSSVTRIAAGGHFSVAPLAGPVLRLVGPVDRLGPGEPPDPALAAGLAGPVPPALPAPPVWLAGILPQAAMTAVAATTAARRQNAGPAVRPGRRLVCMLRSMGGRDLAMSGGRFMRAAAITATPVMGQLKKTSDI